MKKLFVFLISFLAIHMLQAQPGILDASFGDNGILSFPVINGKYHKPYSVKIQTDGKIVLAGAEGAPSTYTASVVRLNEDGTPDNTFGNNGVVVVNEITPRSYANDVFIQSDGKIVAAGNTYDGSSSDIICFRLNSDGTLDPNFGTNGIVRINSGGSEVAMDVKVKSDGKVILSGYSDKDDGIDKMCIVQLNSDGSIDTNFGNNGFAVYGGTTVANYIQRLAINEQNGKLIAAGFDIHEEGHIYSSYAIACFNADGTPDLTFNGTGFVKFNIKDGPSFFNAVVVDDEGKIILGGHHWIKGNPEPLTYYMTVMKYNPDGTRDLSFGQNGVAIHNIVAEENYTFGMALQKDKKIVLAGYTKDIDIAIDFAVCRFNEDGTLDTDFGLNGSSSTDISGEDYTTAVAIQEDGKIVLTGYSLWMKGSQYGGSYSVARYIGGNVGVENDNMSFFELYPNPANDVITINPKTDKKLSLKIVDITGKLVKSFAIENKTNIKIEDLESGIYFLNLQSDKENQTVKFIKK